MGDGPVASGTCQPLQTIRKATLAVSQPSLRIERNSHPGIRLRRGHRNKHLLEIAVAAGMIQPYVSRPESIAKMKQHRDLPYCRVSTADQSCERQERDLTAFAGRAGYKIAGIYKETGSGVKLDRAERKKIMALAQARHIDAILVTELSRWGRSTIDLLNTLRELESWKVSVIAMNGMTFDLSSPHGRMLATFLSGIAEFERDLISERVKSGLAVAKARGKKLGRQRGQRPKSDRLAPRVLALVAEGRSYRLIGRELGLSKNTVSDIVQRNRNAIVAREPNR